MKYKIAIAARDPIGTGGGTVALSTAREMMAKGHEVVFVSDYTAASELPGIKNIAMPGGRALRDWRPKKKVLAVIRHFAQIVSFSVFGHIQLRRLRQRGYIGIDHNIEAFGSDIAVLHNVFVEQERTDKRHWIRRVPHWLNPIFSFRLIREKIVLNSRSLSAVVAVAPQLLQEAEGLMRPGTDGSAIPNGIDLVRFAPISKTERDSLRRELNGRDHFIVLFVGHEYERKRLDLVMQAVARLGAQVLLWVVGGRWSSQQTYEDLARALGILDRTIFWGTRSDTERFFCAADCFVLPSDYEAWPLVALEAMACGTPIVMTPVGCAPYVIRNGDTGFIACDAAEIADAISKLADDRDLLDRMRTNARREAEEYGWSSVADKYLDVVARVAVGRT
ncbi:glycosyltransferase family 4 protein [Dyella sp. C9]|uniref:glycosyltransferase family 4 protein n=1 Tax=Dyella sp. C9 TaxID=2202154 RepID=UPI000DEF1672|nr:glycosyltransferase family 4 protein [Dyella sp. C9]